jgi:hypothetical protein
MKIYLLYKTEDMINMKTPEIRDIKIKLEESLTSKPVYDLAMIDTVLWRVAVAEADASQSELKACCGRLDIPRNSQGFQGTALSSEGNSVSEEFIYQLNDNNRPPRRSLNLSSIKK